MLQHPMHPLGSAPESRPHWCTNAHTHGAAPRAKHVTIQKWRCRRVCFVHRQLPKFPIDILSLACSSQPWHDGTVYECLTSTFTRVGDNNHVIDTTPTAESGLNLSLVPSRSTHKAFKGKERLVNIETKLGPMTSYPVLVECNLRAR